MRRYALSPRQLAGLLLAAGGLASATAVAAADTAACRAASGPARLHVVELYTSEGCSSCPPADRWLSTLQGRADVLAQAFHVDYWDRLGWKDRFASPAYTERQAQWRAALGARFVYTPQLIVDGMDRKDLPAQRAPSDVDLTLTRAGPGYVATVRPGPGAPARLAAYWTLTEDGHVSAVRAGENQGATLHHDFVVRDYRPVEAWPAVPGGVQRLRFDEVAAGDAGHPRRVNLVVFDAATMRPLQALQLACS